MSINFTNQYKCSINGVAQRRAKKDGSVIWRATDVLQSVSGASEQRNLPESYTQLKDIQSTSSGKQMTTIPVYADSTDTQTICRFRILGVLAYGYVFGHQSVTTGYWGLRLNGGTLELQILYGKAVINTGVKAVLNTSYTFTMTAKDNVLTWEVNGTSGTSTVESAFTSDKYIGICCGSGVSYYGYDAIEYFYTRVGTDEYECIPAKRTSDSAIGLYDKNHDTIYTSATSTAFVAGDEQSPSPDVPIEILSCGDKTKNLLNPTLTGTTTLSGITCTANSDGTYTLNGTATANALSFQLISDANIQSDGLYMLGCPTKYGTGSCKTYFRVWYTDNTQTTVGTSSTKALLDSGKTIARIILMVDINGVCENEVIKPMLTTDTSATYDDYEPYGYKVECVDEGVNLFNPTNLTNTKTYRGVTITKNGDTLTLNGTQSAVTNLSFTDYFSNFFEADKTYTCTFEIVSGSATLGEGSGITYSWAIFSGDNAVFARTYTNNPEIETCTFTFSGSNFSGKETVYMMMQAWREGTVFDNLTLRFQIEEGSTATDYVPYHEPKTWHCYLSEPLRKVRDYADVLGKTSVTRKVKEVALNTIASSDWSYNSAYTRFVTYFTDMNALGVRLTPLLSNEFIGISDGRSIDKVPNYGVYGGGSGSSKEVWFKTTDVSTVADFMTMVADANIIYPLATPTTESITWYDSDGNADTPKLLDGESMVWETEIQPSAESWE